MEALGEWRGEVGGAESGLADGLDIVDGARWEPEASVGGEDPALSRGVDGEGAGGREDELAPVVGVWVGAVSGGPSDGEGSDEGVWSWCGLASIRHYLAFYRWFAVEVALGSARIG